MSLNLNNTIQQNSPVYSGSNNPREKQISFGDSNYYYMPANYNDEFEEQNAPAKHAVRNVVKTITGSVLSIIGFNVALCYLQKLVNSKLLIGKINKHFADKINDNAKLERLADDMQNRKELNISKDKVLRFKTATSDAYFDHSKNQVVTGIKESSALFHELGHAVIENKTKFLRTLQRGRGHYTEVALMLYALASANKNSQNGNNDSGNPLINFLKKHSSIIPILAYSPELITEGMATKYGLNFLKSIREDVVEKDFKSGKIKQMLPKEKMITKDLYKNIKRSYLTCFGTYLFIPVSIMILNKLDDWAHHRN